MIFKFKKIKISIITAQYSRQFVTCSYSVHTYTHTYYTDKSDSNLIHYFCDKSAKAEKFSQSIPALH